jgi:YD repeat-containing protein
MGIERPRHRTTAAIIAAIVTAILAAGTPASATTPGSAPGEDRSGWSQEQRRRHGQQIAPQRDTEPVIPTTDPTSPTVRGPRAPMPGFKATATTWPDASTATIDIAGRGAVRAGLVRIDDRDPADTGGRRAEAEAMDLEARPVQVRVLDRAGAQAAGVEGLLLAVVPDDTADAALDVSVDYAAFADAYGGDWSSRLRMVQMPDCALTTPSRPECRTQSPVASTNDTDSQTVTASLTAASFGVLAVTAGASGSTGNWSATPLSPSASWQVSGQTGDFSWSYPMRTPPVVRGPQPDLSLAYSSGSLDGKVASTNNQTSWIGDGWNLDGGYIERKYVSCAQDAAAGANNVGHLTGDLCWSSDNATLVFAGRSSDLVRDAATGTWRLKEDDGTRIERFTGGSNDDNDGEYWKVTTTDGAQYWFGRDRRPADSAALNSAWSVPVFGNNPGEPCYSATFAASSCTQTWRWNLEYAVDTSSNSLTYFYAAETNHYGRNLNQAVSSYTRGGYLTRIDYGQRAGSETAANAVSRVDFTVAERCLPNGSITCDPAQLTSATAASWPDVPFDLICTSTTTCPEQTSPAFFTRKRLTTVTTRVAAGSGFQDVDSWTLRHTFPDPGDGTKPSLWLDAITHTGLAGATAITLPDVTFVGSQMANRVDAIGDYGPPMYRYRLIGIEAESGAKTTVNYLPADCTPASLPASPDSNTRRCFPVRWQPEGTGPQVQEYFHKYLVSSVIENPNDSSSASVETSYSYVGDPAWHYDNNPLVPVAERTWAQFRGYGTVDVISGSAAGTQSVQRTRYFRGMDGDHLASGATRSVTVDGIADTERLNGFVREEITYNGVGGPVISGVLTSPWISPATATGADGTTATYLAEGASEARILGSALPGGVRTTRVVTTYDPTYGLPTQVDDQGDIATAQDDRCTRTEYAQNTGANIVATVRRTETVSVACATTPSRPANVIADARTLYDGGAFGAAPTRGLVTAVQVLADYVNASPVYLTQASTTFDDQGRPITATDAMGRTSTTAYTPSTGGPVTGTTVTAPDPDGTGPITASVTTVELAPAWGSPVKVTDPNGKVTSATRDALGRTSAVWLPGRTQGTKTANTTFAYTVSRTGPNTVTTQTLTAAETYLTSVELFDGLLRPRQTQSPSAARDTPGRIITDTVYDSRGLVSFTRGQWFTTGAPATTVAIPAIAVPSRTRFVYDGAGRTTAEIFDVNEQEYSRTTTTYDGDRVSVDPPTGATPQTSITDARGQLRELRQYTGPAPSGTYQAATYGYDAAGRLTAVTDAAGNTWTYGYDLRGRQTSSTDPDKGTTTSTFNDADQVATTTDARSNTLVYLRDQLGRPTQLRETSATGTLRASWVYDTIAKGQLTSSTRYAGTAQYTTAVTAYDDGYRPLGQSVTIPATEGALAGTYTTTYTYTADGQLKSTKVPAAGGIGSETVTTVYDAVSRPVALGGSLGFGMYVADALYDVYGETLRLDLGNTYSFFVNYSYQGGTRRLASTWVEREGVAGADIDLTYTYDQAGNPTSIVDRPTAKPVDAQCFSYDGLRRLSSAWTPSNGDCAPAPSVAALGGPAPYWVDYTFDAAGNRATDVSHAAAGNTTRTYTYPAAGAVRPHAVTQVTQSGAGGAGTSSYGYDATGNTTTRNVAGQAGQTLTWDKEGRLESVTQSGQATASFVYDAAGERLLRRQGGTVTAYLALRT